MNTIASGIVPVFLLIAFGFLLRRRALFDMTFWDGIDRLVFYILFPALLVSRIGTADLGGLEILPMTMVMASATLVVAMGAVWIRPRLQMPGPAFVAVFQGLTRPNTYLGLSLAAALYGDAGIALVAVCIVAVIPLVNVLAVIAHLRWAQGGNGAAVPSEVPWHTVISKSLANPVICACLLGAALNLSGLGLPPLVGPTLTLAGQAALPLGLLAVGAGLEPGTLVGRHRYLLGTTLVKMVALPLVTWALCQALSVEGISAAICVLFSALPVSATSYVMSRQMGGDGPLMAAIVTATTLAAGLILPAAALLTL